MVAASMPTMMPPPVRGLVCRAASPVSRNPSATYSSMHPLTREQLFLQLLADVEHGLVAQLGDEGPAAQVHHPGLHFGEHPQVALGQALVAGPEGEMLRVRVHGVHPELDAGAGMRRKLAG